MDLMRNKLLLTTLALTLGALIIPACGSSTTTDNGLVILSADGVATNNGNGTFDLDLTVDFSDVAPVDTYFLDCTDSADPTNDFHEDNGLISPAVSSGTFQITIPGVSATPFTYTCTLQLVDIDNIQSALFDFNFNLS